MVDMRYLNEIYFKFFNVDRSETCQFNLDGGERFGKIYIICVLRVVTIFYHQLYWIGYQIDLVKAFKVKGESHELFNI